MAILIDSPSGLAGVPFSIVELSRRNFGGPVIYYLERADGAVKIGTTRNFAERRKQLIKQFGSLTLLAWEPGHFGVEQQRHAEFFWDRLPVGEWFVMSPELRDHIVDLRWSLRERGLA